jgi:hypothetical protein
VQGDDHIYGAPPICKSSIFTFDNYICNYSCNYESENGFQNIANLLLNTQETASHDRDVQLTLACVVVIKLENAECLAL